MAKTRQGKLLGKYGTKVTKAVAKHAGEPIDYGSGGDLPPGITGGIAQLAECKFDTYKKGEDIGEVFFYAAGIVITPTTLNGLHIQGLRTSIMEPVCATPSRKRKDVDEHVAWIMNELGKLGAEMEAGDDLETVVAALKDEAPYFSFRTWQGEPTDEYPNPRVNHQWGGIVEGYVPEDVEGVEDATTNDDAEEEDAEEAEDAEEDEAEEDDAEEEDAEEDEDEQSLLELGEAADEGDADAIASLTAKAEAEDIDPNDYATWAEVADLLDETDDSPEDEGEEEEDDEPEPVAGDVWGYKPPKARKAIDCNVTAIFAKKQTCNLKSIDTNKVYKGVGWNELIQAE